MMTEKQKQDLAAECRRTILDAEKPGAGYRTVARGEIARIALAALTQPASPALKLPDAQEQVIGVWNPSTNEIAVRKLSGIKIVDFAHWHCHCTKEVVIRDISDHPTILNAPHTAPIEHICATGGAEWVKCSERMPEADKPVLAGFVGWSGKFEYECYARSTNATDEDWVWCKCDNFGKGDWWADDEYEITHWMPLPAAPEGE